MVQAKTGEAQTEALPSPDIFILGVPFSDSAGEEGGRAGQVSGEFPFGVKTALSFLKAVREDQMKENTAEKIRPGRRIAVAFLEDGDGEFRGLEDLASSLDYPENAALVYLDFASPPGRIMVIHHGTRGGITHLAMVRPLPGSLRRRGVPHVFGVRSHELYNLGLAAGPAILELARSLEIPAILLTSAGIPGAPDPDALAEALAEYAAAVQWETGGMDTHYSLFAYGERIFFLSERMTVILILFLAGIGIALWLRRSVLRRHNRRLSVTNAARQSGQEERPAGGSPRADHCAHIAVFLAILGILGGTFLDLSCAPAFIWALAFTILGAALHFVPAVFICALLSPFKGAETIFQTLRSGAFTGVPMNPEIYLLPALLILPFLFLVFRGIILIVDKKNSRIPPEEIEKSKL
jgi:hypothetical protein